MPSIIPRAKWGARHDRGFRDAPLPAREVWLHHSVTIAPDLKWVDADGDNVDDDEERAMRTLEDIGEQRFGGGISYTFAVMPSGRIYEGHGVNRQGAHTGGRNDIARAIVLVGDYTKRAPTAAQESSIAWLLRHGKAHGWWVNARLNGGHRQAPGASTACPGDAAFARIDDINRKAAQPTPTEDDMPTPAELWGYNGTLSKDAWQILRDAAEDAERARAIATQNQVEIRAVAKAVKDLTALVQGLQ